MEKKLLNTTELGEHLFLTRSRIADLKRDGVFLPEKNVTARGRGGGNLFDPDKNRERYIKFLRKMKAVERGQLSAGKAKKSGSTHIEGFGYDDEIKKETLREKKRKNDLAENEITSVSVVQFALMRVATKISSIIEKIIPNIIRLWPEIDEELLEVIEKSITQALIEAANIELSEDDLVTNDDEI